MNPTMTTTPSRRKILLLTQDLEVWGAQRQIVELAKQLNPSLYDVRLGTLERHGPLIGDIEALGIPVKTFERRWRWDLSPIGRLVHYLRREEIDIIHSFLFLPNFYARFAGKLARTPAIVSSLRSTGIEGWHRYLLDVATCFLCDALIANSAAGRDDYVRHGGLRRRIVVVPNGLGRRGVPPEATALELRKKWGLAQFETLIGMVGAIEWRKDQALLVHAMKEVLQVQPRAGLVLAGDGSLRERLETLVRSEGLQSHVVLLGTIQSELLYPCLDLYVQASAFGEGVSNSVLEAMSHALPVVATDVGGNREVVVDGFTGVLVPAGDAPALARAILSLLADSAQRERLGNAGRHRVRTVFSPDRMVADTERVYDDLLASALPHRSPHSAAA